MDQLTVQTASTAPDTGEIFRWMLAQVVGWLISHIQSVMAVLTLLAVIVVILLGGKSIWRFTRVTVDRVWRGLSAVGWRLKRGLSSRAAAGIGGEMMEMLLIEPVGEPLSDHELNNELAQLTQTVGRLDVCIVPAGSSLLPPDLSPSTPYIYLLRADVPIDILQQQLAAFRTHKVRPVSIEWPTLFETSTWSMQVRQFLDQLRQVHRDIAAAETNKKRIGRLYVGLKNVVGAASAWWSGDPKRSMWDYVVDPETQSQHAMSLSAASTRESELETSSCHYPPRSLLDSARQIGDVCLVTTITPPPESDGRRKGHLIPLIKLIRWVNNSSDSESDDETPSMDPDSQFGIDQRLLIWSEAGVDVSDVEGAFKNAFRVVDGEELQIRGKLQDDHQAAKAYKRLVNADGPRSRPSTGSIIGRVRSNQSPVVLVDGDRLAVLSLVGPIDETDLPPIDPGEPEE